MWARRENFPPHFLSLILFPEPSVENVIFHLIFLSLFSILFVSPQPSIPLVYFMPHTSNLSSKFISQILCDNDILNFSHKKVSIFNISLNTSILSHKFTSEILWNLCHNDISNFSHKKVGISNLSREGDLIYHCDSKYLLLLLEAPILGGCIGGSGRLRGLIFQALFNNS